MKYSLIASVALVGRATALTQECNGKAVDEGGNWFCGAVSQILYEGFGRSGSFKGVSSMEGGCQTEDVPFDGPLGPLEQDLSIHIRGPFQLKQAAVYYLGSDNAKRSPGPSTHVHARRHAHNHHHHLHEQKREADQQQPAEEKREEDWVVATIDGQVVSWINNYFGPTPAPEAAPAPTQPAVADPAPVEAPAEVPPVEETPAEPQTSSSTSSGSNKPTPSKNPAPSDGASGPWERIAYYNAEPEQPIVENMVFLGNYGGQGSGVWDTTYGNSLSYVNAEGNGGASEPQVLKNVQLASNQELAIFSAEKCDESCGYARAQDVAYKGFSGSNKVFLFEFTMPYDGNRGFNGDMPAIWSLNGRIPRTQQYGDCSCWQTGCGEVDILEVLAPGDSKCKSTFHFGVGGPGAGSSDYFERPADRYIKVATVFDGATSSVSIKEIPDNVDFSSALDAETVASWLNTNSDIGAGLTSLFQVG
jgi:hypothetical protein